ncbi:hypothetical protein HELRODRAFT_166111 [Helobdella robusta]|uniref:Uncharacterized protein n=1 Tax=Helobdella robusta TaxID=6412 RepID=T1EXS3_HELRO|nr:hypothetical protein HELRODRAFT_166111 [Helobdella robusta]ESN90445.1 hypothetical protein HELRODRAFT_166111 [Helobdella robusta]
MEMSNLYSSTRSKYGPDLSRSQSAPPRMQSDTLTDEYERGRSRSRWPITRSRSLSPSRKSSSPSSSSSSSPTRCPLAMTGQDMYQSYDCLLSLDYTSPNDSFLSRDFKKNSKELGLSMDDERDNEERQPAYPLSPGRESPHEEMISWSFLKSMTEDKLLKADKKGDLRKQVLLTNFGLIWQAWF